MILRGHSERLGLLDSRVTTEFCPETLEGALKTGLSRVNVMAKQVGLDLRIATLPVFPIFYNWFVLKSGKPFLSRRPAVFPVFLANGWGKTGFFGTAAFVRSSRIRGCLILACSSAGLGTAKQNVKTGFPGLSGF